MINYLEALEILQREARLQRTQLTSEVVSLTEIVGRVAASDILSPESVPAFANSAMDGFAVSERALVGAVFPLCLKARGSIAAGDQPRAHDLEMAVEIMTGAPLPEGFDRVVKVEDVRVRRDESGQVIEVELTRGLAARENTRAIGEDFVRGTRLVAAGERLRAEHVLVLASVGVTSVAVRKRPRVAVISTGKELVAMQTAPVMGQIRNSTAPFLVTELRRLGCETTHVATFGDGPADFEKRMRELVTAESYDLILTTGAVSMGKHDYVTNSIRDLGATTYFHKVAIRPGKPILFARFVGGTSFFGLPGNPVSGVVGVRFFVVPYLQTLLGVADETTQGARLVHEVNKPEGLRCFFKARVSVDADARQTVEVLKGQMSFMVGPLLHANAWAVLPEGGTQIAAGQVISVVAHDVLQMPTTPHLQEATRSESLACC